MGNFLLGINLVNVLSANNTSQREFCLRNYRQSSEKYVYFTEKFAYASRRTFVQYLKKCIMLSVEKQTYFCIIIFAYKVMEKSLIVYPVTFSSVHIYIFFC